jgi:hypothetical protein
MIGKSLVIAALLYAPATFAATIYPADSSPESIAVDREVKAKIGRSACMFVDSETGKCSMQSVYNGGGDGGSAGGSASSGSSGAGGSAGGGSAGSGGGSGSGSGSGGSSGGGGTGGCK